MRKVLLFSALLIACVTAQARAQSEAAIGVGLSVSTYDPTGQLGQSSTSMGPMIRINLGPGLGPAIGFDWHSVGVEAMAGSQRVYLGKVRVRPVLGGISYNVKRGKYWISPSLTGGYAFVGLRANDQARTAFRSNLGTEFVSFEARNSFVWRLRLGLFYDAAPRVGVSAAIAYMGVRPTLRITTDRGIRQSTLDASCTVLTFGLVYGVF
jgi:hypothetical protein